jgi:hypothetical protein
MARADNDEKLESAPVCRDRTHWLYMAVIAAVVLGIIVGLANPELGIALKLHDRARHRIDHPGLATGGGQRPVHAVRRAAGGVRHPGARSYG